MTVSFKLQNPLNCKHFLYSPGQNDASAKLTDITIESVNNNELIYIFLFCDFYSHERAMKTSFSIFKRNIKLVKKIKRTTFNLFLSCETNLKIKTPTIDLLDPLVPSNLPNCPPSHFPDGWQCFKCPQALQ